MKQFIIIGTGTNIGKTFITAALARQLREKGETVQVLKPIISGWQNGNNDAEVLLAAAGKEINEANIEACSPWRLKAPLAADMAASLENRKIVFSEVVKFCQQPFEGIKLIEGSGGIMSPLNEEKTFIDLVYKLKIPTILVTGSYLGSISHTLTALQALRELDVRVIINESEGSEVNLQKTANSICRFTSAPLKVLSHCNGPNVPDLTDLLNTRYTLRP